MACELVNATTQQGYFVTFGEQREYTGAGHFQAASLMMKEETVQPDAFYLHEDEWAMIDLLPSENFGELLRTAREAQTFGEEHFDGSSWTDIYVVPRPTYPLSLRALTFNELQSIMGERFHLAHSVQSEFISYSETPPGCFAFVEAEEADGAFYGEQENGLVTRLHLLPCNKESRDRRTCFTDILHAIGSKYDLVLADWWSNTIVDLQERNMIEQYLEASSDQESSI